MTMLYHLNQLQFAYAKKTVLEIEQLEISANNVTALLGNNGAGKSTLLKLLAFLESPQQGQLLFKGKNSNTSSLLSLRKRVVLVAQKPYLLKGTVLDNVLLGLKFRSIPYQQAKKQANEALEQVGIASFSSRHVAKLSGGEAQKVALARALALKPEVLLLDEPFTHLDQESIKHLSHIMTHFSQSDSQSVIFSAHDGLHVTTLAEKTIFLRSGHCVDAGLF
ncbi:MAG: energy-coupling factor ABC transporter ATP-binding protein [Methylococcaceae bacterium]|nr:energy-coupling factor ABC transporter ATP-binding protein [Methylococcaceae bacterium]